MPEVLSIGPVLLPTQRTGLVLCLLLGIYLGGWLAGRYGGDRNTTRGLAEGAVIAGLLSARLGFGLWHWEAYAGAPLSLLYLWQPGYDWWAGLAGAAGWVAWRLRRRPPGGRALLAYGVAGFVLPAVLFGALSAAVEWSRQQGPNAVSGTFPPAVLADLDGKAVDSLALQGRPAVVNFWASWCRPCRRELPLLTQLQQRHGDRGLQVIAVNVAEEAATVRDFLAASPLGLEVWLDPGHDTATTQSLHSRLRVRGLPTTYFVDAKGMIRSRYIGELSRALIEIRVAELY